MCSDRAAAQAPGTAVCGCVAKSGVGGSPLAASKYEATQGQWTRIAGTLPGLLTAALPAGDDFPVGNVNFAEAEGFSRKLTAWGCTTCTGTPTSGAGIGTTSHCPAAPIPTCERPEAHAMATERTRVFGGEVHGSMTGGRAVQRSEAAVSRTGGTTTSAFALSSFSRELVPSDTRWKLPWASRPSMH